MTAVYLGSLSINPLPGLVMDVSPWAGAYQAFYYWVFGGQETGFMSTSASMWWDGQLVLNPGERLYAAATGGPVALQGSGAVMPVLS